MMFGVYDPMIYRRITTVFPLNRNKYGSQLSILCDFCSSSDATKRDEGPLSEPSGFIGAPSYVNQTSSEDSKKEVEYHYPETGFFPEKHMAHIHTDIAPTFFYAHPKIAKLGSYVAFLLDLGCVASGFAVFGFGLRRMRLRYFLFALILFGIAFYLTGIFIWFAHF
jgi:hypothetical protein